ncbi:hypothetical protein F5887DRAFT_918042 [Amanita rubescens]|nr:hypothetical protein F5887DRAFT_918042 [Amanita rubescens]
MLRYAGVSHKSIIRTNWEGFQEAAIVSASKRNERMCQVQEQRRAEITEMDPDYRAAVTIMDLDMTGSTADTDSVQNIAPPGEELEISHEGGDFEVFTDIAKTVVFATGRKYAEYQNRRNHTENTTAHWETQLERLVDAYLLFQKQKHSDSMPMAADNQADCHAVPLEIETVDLFYHKRASFQRLLTEEYPNEALVHHGYLGCSPLHPTIPYHSYLRNQLMEVYDVYLEICCRVDARIDKALKHDSFNRLARQCPACFTHAPGERDGGEFSVLVAMDGNNSLKCISSKVRAHNELPDSRQIVSERWLTREMVDKFGNNETPNLDAPEPVDNNMTDVFTCSTTSLEATLLINCLGLGRHPHGVGKRCQEQQHMEQDHIPESSTADECNETNFGCDERWRNANPEARKQLFSLFNETGVFIACCRHRTVLYICNMVQSGELSKYPLAIVNQLLEDIGDRIGCAYDIGCTFSKTLGKSSLGLQAATKHLRMMVGAFHGHSHNRGCQLSWHPLYIKGTGLTEGEGCEHIFASSNDIARNTRHGSRFHRQQAIEEHFKFWDQDKYALLSKFIVNHYREAADAIQILESELTLLKAHLGLSDEDFEKFYEQEKEYFRNVKSLGSPLSALKGQGEFNSACAAARSVFDTVATEDIHVRIIQAKNRLDKAAAMTEATGNIIVNLEAKLGIKNRWTANHPDYQTYYEENVVTEYQRAVDELERLVVMRLFELTKMGASGTGIPIFLRIDNGLTESLQAIRKAIKRYNTQAAKLRPAKPPLSWKKIVEYGFLAEFDVLRLTVSDESHAGWTKQANREAAIKYFKLLCAQEELEWLNLEINRLDHSIRTETEKMSQALETLATQDAPLASELEYRQKL